MGEIAARMRHAATIGGQNVGKGAGIVSGSTMVEGRAVISRILGALMRAVMVAMVIATPSLMLPSISMDTGQIVALIALFAGALTLFEYASVYPGLIEFRDAPPFNRLRFIALFAIVLYGATVFRAETAPTTLSQFLDLLGLKLGRLIDIPYSPVRVLTLMLPPDAAPETVERLRTIGGVGHLISLVALLVFGLTMRFGGWPLQPQGFNVWVNLPTFDPTAGGDVVDRLRRDAWGNLALGFLLPFLLPAFIKTVSMMFSPITLDAPQTMIWTVTAWCFLPLSLLMRGLAMGRVAGLIAEKRRMSADAQGYQPA